MKDSQQILDQLEQKIAPSQNNSTTPVGRHNDEVNTSSSLSPAQKDVLIKTINECFELLRINYQHLYMSAYPKLDSLNAAKKLWLENLQSFEPAIIIEATHQIIRQSDFLPTISRMVKLCMELSFCTILPSAYDAYVEACQAPSPKQNYSWTHPAIYFAGKHSGWYLLASSDEKVAYPIFQQHYDRLCAQVMNGQALPEIDILALPETSQVPLSKEENSERMAALRELTGL